MGRKELVLLEEQTVLSRERTMQQYITTGLGFMGLGVVVMKFFIGNAYIIFGALLIGLGFMEMGIAYLRFLHYRKIARNLRKKEKGLRLEVGE